MGIRYCCRVVCICVRERVCVEENPGKTRQRDRYRGGRARVLQYCGVFASAELFGVVWSGLGFGLESGFRSWCTVLVGGCRPLLKMPFAPRADVEEGGIRLLDSLTPRILDSSTP